MSASPAAGGFHPPYDIILEGLMTGQVIPFLGAGASLAGRPTDFTWTHPESRFPPTAAELASYLDRRSGFPSRSQLELTRVAQYYDVVAGPGGLTEQLEKIFSQPYAPDSIHEYLTEFPRLLIVTTNYDCLLETAFDRKEKPYHLVIYQAGNPLLLVKRADDSNLHAEDPQTLDLELGAHPIIFKMHGSSNHQQDPQADKYVISEDNYVEFLARLANQTAIPKIFGEPFRRSHFLFLGYGLRDWNLRVILHQAYLGFGRRHAAWAVQEHAEELEQEFWKRRNLIIYPLTIRDFLAGLTNGHCG